MSNYHHYTSNYQLPITNYQLPITNYQLPITTALTLKIVHPMSRLVVLNLANGDLYNGFPAVSAQVWNYSDRLPMRCMGCLPAAPEIAKLYRSWQLLYEAIYCRLSPRIEIEVTDVTNVSQIEFKDLCQQLSNKINDWLNSQSFRKIEQRLRTQLDPDEEIRFIIETNDDLLRRLPWHLWKFFEDYPQAEIALSAAEYRQPNRWLRRRYKNKIRVLAVFGDRTGIDIEQDRIFLSQLSQRVETEFLVEPQPEELDDRLRQDWDILFFAGHSSSKEQGLIQLNRTDSLTLDRLKNALKKAINRGLQLAIFNSCDGLGLVKSLEELHIPQAIAMREPVPDAIAHAFLKYFLAAFFLEEQSLYTSVREARERLQKLENQYPCATWLPVICQNPATEPINWQTLRGLENSLPFSTQIRTILLASILVTVSVIGVRQLGVLQPLELSAFDVMMRLRPDEKPDPRILIVTITEADVQAQPARERGAASLSDRALAQLVEKLEQFQPRVIGLDIYRENSVQAEYAKLATWMRKSDRFIAICKVGDDGKPGVLPPPEVPTQRQGFSDVVLDSDGILRRHLLAMTPASPCMADESLSLQLATRYLANLGIKPKLTPEKDVQINNIIFKNLDYNSGGYHGIDHLGHQVLLNWRASNPVALQVTLADVFNNKLTSELVRDRIVLIGTTAESFHDYRSTPYSAGKSPHQPMPGVVIQAHMVSQILSAVLDRRPLLWVWSKSSEFVWIFCWSLIGGLLAGCNRSVLTWGIAIALSCCLLYLLCFALLIQGGWIPLIPSVLALLATSASITTHTTFLNQKQP